MISLKGIIVRHSLFIAQIILEKIQEFNDFNRDVSIPEEKNCDTEFASRQIFKDRLIKLRHKGIITDEAIRDQVFLIIFGGQDTSTYTIAMTIFLLAAHPKVEHLVMNELNEVFGDQPIESDLTMDHVNQLNYLE